ncbi:polysaccharide deacetylase family protein [Pelagibacteraceae bacterium]|nr:polysaccharide deacetylase family protein [Pelagibacteraceae bacterium]
MIKTYNNNIYVVMYHYVRDIKKTKFPKLKALDIKDFKEQINYFKSKFNILNQDSFLEIINSNKVPKKKSVLLTFDDGYKDHFKFAFPILKKNNISGIFYPPVLTIKNNKVLDVNKIHFLLEIEEDREKILNEIDLLLKKITGKYISDIDLSKINLKSRFDDKKTKLIKQLLQNFLPTEVKKKILNKIFGKIVLSDEKAFAKQLYLNKEQVLEMNNNKMFFGLHGYNHIRLEYLSVKEQKYEIENSINYFKKIGISAQNISFCYPYGSYNRESLSLLKKNKIKFALTTKLGTINNANISNTLEIPRYDANDFLIEHV